MEHNAACGQFDLVREFREAVVTAEQRRATGVRLLVAGIAVIGMASAAIFFLWPHVAVWFAA